MSQSTPSAARPHRGTLILVLGILGLVICMPLGIAAWVMGSGDLKAMAAGQMDRSGQGMTNAGRICGIVSVILWVLGILLWVLVFGALMAGGMAE